MRPLRVLLLLAALLGAGSATAFDHGYADYGVLLQRHVQWSADGHASTVDYANLKRERAALAAVLASWSAVDPLEFARWSREQQIAFLTNAYNGYTLEKVLTRYPDLRSIRDLGRFLRSPWKDDFFRLLGEPRSLDWIEHEQLRPRYREPRLHFALNCASVGCPALRPEPYLAGRLSAQLDDQERRFLTDRRRNRYDAARDRLEVSAIFDWFGEDFAVGGGTLRNWLIARAALLADTEVDRQRLRRDRFEIEPLDYDWSLNDRRRSAVSR